MGERVLSAGARRPYVVPALLAAVCAIATFLTAAAEDLPIRDPDGVGGPPLVRLSVILGVFVLLDIIPRGLHRGGLHPTRWPRSLLTVARERWDGRRTALVLVGLFSFYIVYVCYRNFKGFLPFLTDGQHDAGLLSLDQAFFAGHDPATLLHDLLGTGFANEFLSFIYVIYLAFVPISLAAALVWFGDLRRGLWYATALSLNWILGAISYYMIPSLGPAFVAPELFSDLAPTASSALQHSLWVERLNVLFGTPAEGAARDLVQSIAAFASLHVSVVLTAALVAQLVRANRWLRWGLWTYFWLVMVATIYLGWHYVIDDVAGIVIGVAATALGGYATGHRIRFVPGRRRRHAVVERADVPALNPANMLSCLRIVIAPIVVAVMLAHPDGSLLAAALFAAGGLTDILDGHLARRHGLITPLGKLLDPTADKLLVLGALGALVAVDRLAWWVLAVIAAREVLVTLLRWHAVRRGVVIAAGPAGKVKMGFQVAMTLVLMAASQPFAPWIDVLVATTVVLTVVSGLDYVRGYLRAERTVPAAA